MHAIANYRGRFGGRYIRRSVGSSKGETTINERLSPRSKHAELTVTTTDGDDRLCFVMKYYLFDPNARRFYVQITCVEFDKYNYASIFTCVKTYF